MRHARVQDSPDGRTVPPFDLPCRALSPPFPDSRMLDGGTGPSWTTSNLPRIGSLLILDQEAEYVKDLWFELDNLCSTPDADFLEWSTS